MNGIVLFSIIASLIGGISLGYFLNLPVWCAIFPLFGAVSLFIFAALKRRKNSFYISPKLNLATSILLFFALGFFSMSLSKPSDDLSGVKGTYFIRGTVEEFYPTNSGDKLLVDLEEIKPLKPGQSGYGFLRNSKAYLYMSEASNVSTGDVVAGSATLYQVSRPKDYLNDDYVSFLHQNNIYLEGYLKNDCRIYKSGFSFFPWIKGLKYSIESFIEKSRLQSSTKGFLIAILLGDKSYLSREERLNFTDAGVAHIFAVSGFHVSLIAAFILGLLSMLFYGNLKKWKFLLALPLIWFYILLVGVSPSTSRAGIMITLGFLALFLERKTTPLKTLCWAIILIIGFYPKALFDIGFQLSVVCVGAIVSIARPLNFIDHRSHPRLFKIIGLIIVSITASFATWVLCAFYFQRFSLMFLPLNILAVPLLPLFVALALVFLMLSAIGIQSELLAKVLDKAYSFFCDASGFISSLSSPIENVDIGPIAVILWLLGIGFVGWFISTKRRHSFVLIPSAFFTMALLSIWVIPAGRIPDGFIMQKSISNCSILDYHNGIERLVSFPDKSCSMMEISGKRILALHSKIPSDELQSIINSSDYIIIAGKIKSLPDHLLSSLAPGAKVVTHPSLHWRYERCILAQAKERNIEVHSLRYDGPLHVFQ